MFAMLASEAGAHSQREVFVPEFHPKPKSSQPCTDGEPHSAEAWMDVYADGTPDITDVLGGVTVCHPAATRYVAGAAKTSASAAERRAAEKMDHYVQTGGRQLTPLPCETWGRLGCHSEAVLAAWTAAANRRDWQHGRSPNQRAKRWRCMLDACLQHSIARMLHASRFGYALRPCPRSPPPPDPSLTESLAPAGA